MIKDPSNDLVELCARTAHEANRAWCLFIGDTSQVHWDQAADWQKVAARNGVRGILAGETAEESHATWLRHQQANGWVYGKTKDETAKTHPALMPYSDLPPEQKIKDQIYRDAVLMMAKAYGNHPQ